MICPVCGKNEMRTGEFYDHMGEYHDQTLSEAEKHADDQYIEIYGSKVENLSPGLQSILNKGKRSI